MRLAVAGDELADLVEALLGDPRVGWAMGVDGAAAELCAGVSVEVTRNGRSVAMRWPDGSIALTISDEVAAFVVSASEPAVLLLALPDSTVAPPQAVAGCIHTALGRAEVWPGATSGSIVIDPGRLLLDRPLPEQAALPPGWTLGAAAWVAEADARTRARVAAS